MAARGHQRHLGVGELLRRFRTRLRGGVTPRTGDSDFRLQRLTAGALFELFGGRQRRIGRAHETVPAPEVAFAADKALPGLELRDEAGTQRAIYETALGEAGVEFGRRLDKIGERRDADRQSVGHIAMAAGPVDRGCDIGRRVEFIVQRRGDGALQTRRAHAIHHWRRSASAKLAKQAIKALQLGFKFTNLALGGEQRRRQTGLRGARLIDRARGRAEGRLRRLRLRFQIGVALACILQRRIHPCRVADRDQFGFDLPQVTGEPRMAIFLAAHAGLGCGGFGIGLCKRGAALVRFLLERLQFAHRCVHRCGEFSLARGLSARIIRWQGR